MSANASQSTRCCVSMRVFFVGAVVLLLCLPSLLLAQAAGNRSQIEALIATADEAESLPLTTAQGQARQLATVLLETQSTSSTTAKRTPLGIITEQAVYPGMRVILPLFTWQSVEARLVSGEQTFASPVDGAGATETADARRPLFIPASNAAIALEVLAK